MHLAALATKWKTKPPEVANDAMDALSQMAQGSTISRAKAVTDASLYRQNTARLDLMPAFKLMREHADTLDENTRRAIYEDTAVFSQEWDQYLRSDGPSRTLSG
ncbi:DNA helicase UvrD, partial [Paraburkholderia steynii]